MPPTVTTYPGVHVQELPAGAHAIAGVETSVAMFVGRAVDGPLDKPVRCSSFGDFERAFGSGGAPSDLARQVKLFFLNGGMQCHVLRVAKPLDATRLQAAFSLVDGHVDLFNLLVLPRDHAHADAAAGALWAPASVYCVRRRALLLIDPPDAWVDVPSATTGPAGVDTLRAGLASDHAAVFFPRVKVTDNGGGEAVIGPSGTIAGVIARTDSTRGVWKAPAGLEAGVGGITGLALRLSDQDNGMLNPKGINALRAFPTGIVNWGARTLAGDAGVAPEYKYIPVRRLALFIEESLSRGLQWATFEPNGEALWSAIRTSVGAFLYGLFRQGAFMGRTPNEACFVKCDATTTPQSDRDQGIVNVVIGFAPLKPAEFVVIKLQQAARRPPP